MPKLSVIIYVKYGNWLIQPLFYLFLQQLSSKQHCALVFDTASTLLWVMLGTKRRFHINTAEQHAMGKILHPSNTHNRTGLEVGI